MNTSDNAARGMSQLKESLASISTVIPVGSTVALLDEPVHRNIGDHCIQLGTERFFRDHNISLVARANKYNYHRRWLSRKIGTDTIIACCGGGHLGDIYPAHQRLLEQVVADFPSQRIVVLPHSIYFKDTGRGRQSAAILRRHSDFHLFVRDNDSRRQATALGLGELHLAPDMAHALYPLSTPSGPARSPADTLYLLRRDVEKVGQSQPPADAGAACDWADLIRADDTLVLAAIAATGLLFRRAGAPHFLDSAMQQRRVELMARGSELLARHDLIVTSRLHGALMGLLLGKRVRLLASLTGKAQAYYETWLSDIDDITYVPEGL